jgi:hypothetical protein
MEKMPQNHQPENETIDHMFERTNKQSLEKRPAFLSDIRAASTLGEIRAAVEKYAVEDDTNKVVVNYMEGAYSEENETDGREDLSEILAALDSFEKDKPTSYSEIEDRIFNYAIVGRLGQILDLE